MWSSLPVCCFRYRKRLMAVVSKSEINIDPISGLICWSIRNLYFNFVASFWRMMLFSCHRFRISDSFFCWMGLSDLTFLIKSAFFFFTSLYDLPYNDVYFFSPVFTLLILILASQRPSFRLCMFSPLRDICLAPFRYSVILICNPTEQSCSEFLYDHLIDHLQRKIGNFFV